MKIVFFSILIWLLSFDTSSASEVDSVPLMHHAVGVSVSSISGIGLSYRYNFVNQISLKTTGFALPTEISDTRSEFSTGIGFELQYNAIRTRETRFYGFIGTSFRYFKSRYSVTSNNTNSFSYDIDETTNYGGGFGFEGSLSEHLYINFDIGFQSMVTKHTNVPLLLTDNYTHPYSRVGVGGGIGIGYQF